MQDQDTLNIYEKKKDKHTNMYVAHYLFHTDVPLYSINNFPSATPDHVLYIFVYNTVNVVTVCLVLGRPTLRRLNVSARL